MVLAVDPLEVVDRPDPAHVARALSDEDVVHVAPGELVVVGRVAVDLDAPGVPGAVHLVHEADHHRGLVGRDVARPRADVAVLGARGDAPQVDVRLDRDVLLADRRAPGLPGDHGDRPGAGDAPRPVGAEAALPAQPLLVPVDDPRALAVGGGPRGDGAGRASPARSWRRRGRRRAAGGSTRSIGTRRIGDRDLVDLRGRGVGRRPALGREEGDREHRGHGGGQQHRDGAAEESLAPAFADHPLVGRHAAVVR